MDSANGIQLNFKKIWKKPLSLLMYIIRFQLLHDALRECFCIVSNVKALFEMSSLGYLIQVFNAFISLSC